MRGSIKRRWRKDAATGKRYQEKTFTVAWTEKLNGQWTNRKKGGFATRKDADAWFDEEKQRLGRGSAGRDAKGKVANYLRRWVTGPKLDIAASTRRSYRHHVEDYHIPALGDLRLRDLRREHIEAAKDQWETQPGKLGRPISGRFAFLIFTSFRKAMNDAKRDGLLAVNPCDGVAAPTFEQREVEAVDPELAQRIVKVFEDTHIGAAVVTLLGSGLRRGEVLALRWRNVNLAAGSLTVARSLDRVGGTSVFKTPKTKGSRRTVRLPTFVLQRLTRHCAEQEARFKSLGLPAATADSVVFDSGLGEPWVPNTFGLAFARMAKRNGLRMRLHDLRHAYATLALQAGVPLKVVSESLGHTILATTADLYQHVTPALLQEQADRIDALVAGKPRLRAVPKRRAS